MPSISIVCLLLSGTTDSSLYESILPSIQAFECLSWSKVLHFDVSFDFCRWYFFFILFPFLEDEEDLDDETRNRIKTKADRTNDFVDLEIMYPTSPRDLHNYLIPIKIMKFMNEYYFVPNNPILYLERVCFSLTFYLSRRIKRSQNLYFAPFLFEFSF